MNNTQNTAVSQENSIGCKIEDIANFRVCLESVRFPQNKFKNTYNDVVLQAWKTGLSLSSSSDNGVIMTRCMIKNDFFVENSYKVDVNCEKDDPEEKTQGRGTPVVELCIPIGELKQIIDSLEQETIALKYPMGDAQLQVEILEQTYGPPDE